MKYKSADISDFIYTLSRFCDNIKGFLSDSQLKCAPEFYLKNKNSNLKPAMGGIWGLVHTPTRMSLIGVG